MTTAIIYHQVKSGVDCPDGIVSAWIAKKAISDAHLIGCVYQGDIPDLGGYDRVYIVDFSFPHYVIWEWQEEGKEIIIIDHHKTAWEHLQSIVEQINFQYDETKCGATLTWNYFFPDQEPPAFLKYVEDRDLWNFRYGLHTAIVHEGMAILGRKNFHLLDRLALMDDKELIWFFEPISMPLLQPKLEAVEVAASRVEWGEVAGYPNIPFVRLNPEEERLTSDICMNLFDAPIGGAEGFLS